MARSDAPLPAGALMTRAAPRPAADPAGRCLPKPGDRATREARIDRAAIDAESRIVEVAFSSETPVDRWYGREILDHRPGACRLARLADGGALLLGHDTECQVGAIVSAVIGPDRVGRGKCKISRSGDGEDVLQDLLDGIRSKVSVGYIVHAMVLESSQDGLDTYRVTDWEPVEVSLVAIPADPAVGVGRSLPTHEVPMDPEDEILVEGGAAQPQTDTQTAQRDLPPARPASTPSSVVNPDAEAIRAVGRHFGLADAAEDQIMLGATLAQFRDHIRTQRAAPVPSVPRIESRIPSAGTLTAFRPELYAGGRREAEEAAYRAGMFARAVLFGDQEAMRWCRDHQVELAAALAGGLAKRVLTGMAPGQSVVVPEELILPIISLRERYGIARRLCQVYPMSSDTASVPRDIGDVTAYFVGRESAPTANDPTFDNITLTAKNLAAETRIANDYAEDSVINLADHVAQKFARAFAVKEDNCLFNGDGTSTYGGIVGLRVAILGLAGAIDAASGHDTFSEIDASDLRTVMAKLPDYPGIDPSWITSKPGQNALFGRLTDAAGGNTKRDQAQKMPDQWGGYNILTSPAMPKVLTDLSDVAMVLFGDLRMGVLIGDRRGITIMVDPYSLSSYQQTKIVGSERFDINCHGVGDASNPGPVVALVGE